MLTLREAITLTLEYYNKREQEYKLDNYLEHVTEVGACASIIAAACGLNVTKAGIAGYCHDFGVLISSDRKNKTFHGLVGYEFFKSIEQDELAQICLTHSFSSKNFEIEEYKSYGEENIKRAKAILNEIELTDYDKIVTLSDHLVCMGYVHLKDRMNYIEATYNVKHEYIRRKYKNAIKLKREIENKYNCNIYKLLGLK